LRVLLIATNTLKVPYAVYPIGLDYVAGAISGAHDVRIVDLCPSDDSVQISRAIEEHKPEAVCISLRNVDNADVTESSDFIDHFKSIASLVRANTDAPIILGGSAFSIFPKAMMETLDADYGVVGEGERLGLLLDGLARNADIEGIPGVIGRDLEHVHPAPWEGDIQREFNVDRPGLEFYLNRGGMLNLQTKRGCPYKCIYCTYPLIEGSELRLFDPHEVAGTALGLQDAGARFLFITDSIFNSSIEHSLAVAEAFKNAGLGIPWGAYFSPVEVPDDYFQRLADCGLTHVEFGTESMNVEMLRALRKPFDTRSVFNSHDQAVGAGLNVAHYILFGGPGETGDTVSDTLDNLERLPNSAFFFFCGIRIYPNTVLHSIAVREGKISPADNAIRPVFYESSGISPLQIIAAIEEKAQGRLNWVIGGGGEKMYKVIERLHKRGRVGPLWEKLIG